MAPMQKLSHILFCGFLSLLFSLQSQRPACCGEEDGYPLSYYYSGGLDDGGEELIISEFESYIVKVTDDQVVNVDEYGAKGDGKTDDTQAFQKAWEQACSSKVSSVFRVPKKKSYLLKPVTFSGPCKSKVTLEIKGTVKSSSNRSDWKGKNRRHWIVFEKVDDLAVGGGGTVDGNGETWWQHSCKVNKSLPCQDAPTAMTFYKCNDLKVEDLNVKNSQQIHVSFEECNGVKASKLTIMAPENSPNTDGIHVTGSTNVAINNCVIKTGDDCISIVSGSKNVNATNVVCGPGHGISIGSLGEMESEAYVSDVMVNTAKLDGTTNGVRIKTWQGGKGYCKNIVFQNIDMHNVTNPIIIDQNYCDSKTPCKEQTSAVEIRDVLYKNIKGTSASKVAIKLHCSATVPCQGIVLQDINLVEEDGEQAQSSCENVKWTGKGKVIPKPCA